MREWEMPAEWQERVRYGPIGKVGYAVYSKEREKGEQFPARKVVKVRRVL